MKRFFIQLGIILITFAVVFLVTTAFFDTLERNLGYYDEGRQESSEVGKVYNFFKEVL